MFDINFYMKVSKLKKQLLNGKLQTKEKDIIFNEIEELRSKRPVIYNIETTNACNMRCKMCPRTTMMTRPIETMDMDTFKRIIDQIEPFPDSLLHKWEKFVEDNYKISKKFMDENHFFLYIIPKVLVLHGYGEPLLDKYMKDRIKLLNKKQIPSYFSCNPSNIDINKIIEIFENGLDYIKFSIESVDDIKHKEIRGEASNFTKSYEKILYLLELKEKHQYKTTIVITMLNLNDIKQMQEFERLKDAFKDLNIYIYIKSQDQNWYQRKKQQTKSIHWNEFCQFPWSSMTIKSDGKAVECVEDYNNEIVLGDAKKESLYKIWNGKMYYKFRRDHFNLTPNIKCTEHCDMTLIGDLL
jgi:Predicted Fe-S oxidoreductases